MVTQNCGMKIRFASWLISLIQCIYRKMRHFLSQVFSFLRSPRVWGSVLQSLEYWSLSQVLASNPNTDIYCVESWSILLSLEIRFPFAKVRDGVTGHLLWTLGMAHEHCKDILMLLFSLLTSSFSFVQILTCAKLYLEFWSYLGNSVVKRVNALTTTGWNSFYMKLAI